MFSVAVIAVLACFAAGCATIDYVGQSYQPTTQVDVYLSEADVTRPYQVIGQVVATGGQFVTAMKLQERVLLQARQSGADAVVILSFGRVHVRDEQTVTETVTESKDEDERKVEKETTVANVSIDELEIRAQFIRYR